MSASVWQFERPTGARLVLVVLSVVCALGAVTVGGLRVHELRQQPQVSAGEAALALNDPYRGLIIGRPRKVSPAPGTSADASVTPVARARLHESRIVSRALRHVRRRYVDPMRIEPSRMLEASLQAVAHAIAEVLVSVDGRDPEGRPLAMTIRVAGDTLRINCDKVKDLFELDWAIHRVIGFLTARIPQQAQDSHVEYVAVNGLLDTLDPYSSMLDPDAWQEMQTHTGGRFGGLGIRVLTRSGVLTVVGVIDDSPASKAGLKADDRILRINGEDTLNMGIEAAVDRLRGKVGSSVMLLIGRKSWPKPRRVKVVRAVIQLKSVDGRRLTGGVVYARIKNFQRGTANELRRLLLRVQPPDGAHGLVLDLRDNPGGLLDEAVKVCDLLIDGGPVVITVAGGGTDREVRKAQSKGTLADLAVVVLVSHRSASASEIVAGALKESNRAVIMGERTWGKGTVQVPFEIGAGALKLTIAKYLVPGDVSIQDVGVTPDIELRFVEIDRGRISLFEPRSRRVRRKAWAREADVEASGRRPVHRLRLLLPTRREGTESPLQFRDQEPIRRASALLQHAADAQAAVMLAQARPWIGSLRNTDGAALNQRLNKMGANWRSGPQPETPRVRLEIEPVKGGLEVEAGRSIRLPVRVHNRGRAPLYRVHVFSRSHAPALDGVEHVIGLLAPGQSRLVQLRLRPSRRHLDLLAPVEIVVALDGKPLPVSREINLRVKGLPRPHFSWRITVQESQQDDEMLSAGELVKVRVRVRNVGAGVAEKTVASLRSLAGRLLHLEKGRVRLGRLKPGQEAEAVFTARGVRARGGEQTGLLPARLEVTDRRLGTRRSERILLPWRAGKPTKAKVALVRAAVKTTLKRWTQAPRVSLHPGSIAPPPVDAPCSLRLRGTAHFESVSPGRRYLSVSVGGAKRAFVAGHNRVTLPFDMPVALDKGLNRITILARAGREQVAYQQVLVHCTGEPASDAARAASQNAPAQPGKTKSPSPTGGARIAPQQGPTGQRDHQGAKK